MSTLYKSLLLFFILCSCQDAVLPNDEIIEDKFVPEDTNFYNVGFLIMDGVFNTELTAPFDIYHHTKFRT